MSSETPGGASTTGSSLDGLSLPAMSRVRTISDEITIYEITSPIPSKPTLKPLNFEVELFKGSPTKLSPQKLSPLSSSNQNPKILSPAIAIRSPKRESQSPCEQQPQFIHSPSSHNVLLIPSKPELTVTLVSPNRDVSTQLQKTPPMQSPQQAEVVENEAEEPSNDAEQLGETTVGRRKRRKRVFTPHLQKTMYRTRTVVKASLAAQHEKEELAEQKAKNEVPSVKPSTKEKEKEKEGVGVMVVPSFGSGRGRKRNQRKLSTAEQLEQIKREGSIDLESPGSILKLINLKSILTRQNFSRLPPLYQFKLLQLLPDVDSVSEGGRPIQPSEDAFDNLFYNKACEDWKAKLIAGDFMPEQKQRQRLEAEKDKLKVDPWKIKHFEPIWGETYQKMSHVLRRNPVPPLQSAGPSSITAKARPLASPTPASASQLQEESKESMPATEERASPQTPFLESTEEEKPRQEESPVVLKAEPPFIPRPSPIPSPGKRDSAHLQMEVPISAKRFCIIPPIPPPPSNQNQAQVVFSEKEEVFVEETEERNAVEGALNLQEAPQVDEEENSLLCKFNEIPILLEVDNEVTVENSPSPTPSESPDPPDEEAAQEEESRQSECIQVEHPEPPQLEEIHVLSMTDEVDEIPEEAAEGWVHVETGRVERSIEEQIERIVEEQIQLEENSRIQEQHVQAQLQHNQSQLSFQRVPPENEQMNSENMLEQVGRIEHPPIVDITQDSVINNLTTVSTGPTPAVVSISSESISNSAIWAEAMKNVLPHQFVPSQPRPSIVTPPTIRLPLSQQNLIPVDRPSQPLVFRMVSNPPLQSSPGTRMGPPQPPTPLLPIMLKPIGGKPETIRTLVPKVLSDFMSVTPRSLVRLPESGKPQTVSSVVPKTNGPGTGGVQSPSSPGNVSSPISNKKSSRQKPRQVKVKSSNVPPGSVNIERSFQICKAVIQNSPNREQLQKQLVKPPPAPQINNRPAILQQDMMSVSEVGNPMIQVRRATTPTLIQTSGGAMPLLSNVGGTQKLMVVNHQGMTPLLRPVQQTPQGLSLNHQIVVSSQSSSSGAGQRGLGMNVTFTTKHTPSTNSSLTSTTLASAPTIITPHQLALLFQQQQQAATVIPRTQAQTTPLPQQQQQSQHRPSLFISRPQQQLKILNSTQFLSQSRLPSHQILQFQQTTRTPTQTHQDNTAYPLRAQIMTPNGETLTIHRAGGQPMRLTTPLRPSFHTFSVDQGKRHVSPTTTIISRATLPDNLLQSIVTNAQTSNASPPPTLLSPVSNLADFITSQLAASNIRPISPLAFESGLPTERMQHRAPSTATQSDSTNSIPNSNSATLAYSSTNNASHHANTQSHQSILHTQQQLLSNTHSHSPHLTLNDFTSETTILDLNDALGDGSPFSLLTESTNHGTPSELGRLGREGGDLPPPLQPNTSSALTSNHNFPTNSHKRPLEGSVLVQNPRMESSVGDPGRQQQFFIVQTSGSNGLAQNLVFPASLFMPPTQEIKEEGRVVEVGGGPPRAASAPPTNQQPMVLSQQSSIHLQDSKHINLPINFQDFSGIRVVYKNESGRSEDLNGMEYCVTSAPSSYTLTPVSSTGGQGVVRVMNRSSNGSPDVWNYASTTPNGHVVNVNLNGSTGSARIIPGQHPVISIPDTTNGSSTGSSMSTDFDIFSAIAATGSEGLKMENTGDPVLFPVSMTTNNNRQHFQAHGHGQDVVLGSSPNCVCDLRAMMVCRKCGAYCHDDCIKSGTELCMTCMIR